jgi:phage shock protein A
MALMTRLGRLFTADMHAVLDRLEEPEQVLRQALREMEVQASATGRNEVVLRGEIGRLRRLHEQAASKLAALDAELDLCLEEGQDDLARTTIRKKLGCEQRQQSLSSQIERMSDEHAALEETKAQQHRVLNDLRQKAEVFDADPPAQEGEYLDVAVDADAVEVALLKEKQLRQNSGGRASE